MEFIILDLANATEEQLKATIDCNNRTYRMMTSEISKLKKVAETARKVVSHEEVEEVTEIVETKSTIDEDFEHEVEYHYQALKELPEEELENETAQNKPKEK